MEGIFPALSLIGPTLVPPTAQLMLIVVIILLRLGLSVCSEWLASMSYGLRTDDMPV